jgi:hypothetical protein
VDGTGAVNIAGPYQETCTSVGQWGTPTVVGGKCGAVCTPAATQCCVGSLSANCGESFYAIETGAQAGVFTQFCGSNGQWQPGNDCGQCGVVPDNPDIPNGSVGIACEVCNGIAECMTSDGNGNCVCP